jgi:hypothetical protein
VFLGWWAKRGDRLRREREARGRIFLPSGREAERLDRLINDADARREEFGVADAREDARVVAALMRRWWRLADEQKKA